MEASIKMQFSKRTLKWLVLFMIFYIPTYASAYTQETLRVPILTYHNFNPTVPGSMSITPVKFEMQMKWLKEKGYTFIPLQKLVAYLKGEKILLPSKPIVITADDGWESVYHYMFPIARKYHIPVTLFVYPSVISKHKHVLTWEQLITLQQSGLFDVECHTYWHPNFIEERKGISSKMYAHLVRMQLFRSREILEEKLGKQITLLAWPYGIYDKYLLNEAAKAGYTMAFSIDDRPASISENVMSEPRYMVAANNGMKYFAKITRIRHL